MAKKNQKPKGVSELKSDLWTVFSRYIRLRDAAIWSEANPEYNGEPLAACFTCRKTGRAIGQGGMQAGHFVPGRKNAYLFDERQVNAQCMRCNITLGGNWVEYLPAMIAKYGQAEVDHMINEQRHESKSFTIPELEDMLEEYKSKLSGLTP